MIPIQIQIFIAITFTAIMGYIIGRLSNGQLLKWLLRIALMSCDNVTEEDYKKLMELEKKHLK